MSDNNTKVENAATCGDNEKMSVDEIMRTFRLMLALGLANPDKRLTTDGRGMLHLLVGRGDRSGVIDYVRKHKADANVMDENGRTPLCYAVYRSDIAMCRTLLSLGADPNVCGDSSLSSPLYVAAQVGRAELCSMLLKAGASVGAVGASHCTPLYAAARCGCSVCCSMLIDSGADVNACGVYGTTPLHAAATNGHADICRMLIARGAIVDKVEITGMTPLHCAAESGAADVCRVLLHFRHEVDVRDNKSRTPLHLAARHDGHSLDGSCLRMLLRAGADVGAKDMDGHTPLHYAAGVNAHSVRTLLRAGANPNSEDGEIGWTPLHEAAKHNNYDAVEALVAGGADVNTNGWVGTPLHAAMRAVSPGAVNCLLKHGADPHIVDHDGYGVFHEFGYAIGTDHDDFALDSCIDTMIKAGVDINTPTDTGTVPLSNVIRYGNAKAYDAMVRAGAREDAVTDNDLIGYMSIIAITKYAGSVKTLRLIDRVCRNTGRSLVDIARQNGIDELLDDDTPQELVDWFTGKADPSAADGEADEHGDA